MLTEHLRILCKNESKVSFIREKLKKKQQKTTPVIYLKFVLEFCEHNFKVEGQGMSAFQIEMSLLGMEKWFCS